MRADLGPDLAAAPRERGPAGLCMHCYCNLWQGAEHISSQNPLVRSNDRERGNTNQLLQIHRALAKTKTLDDARRN